MRFSKRVLDLSLVIPGVVILLPLYFFISILIIFYDGRPVFFKQKRVGYQGKEFYIIKFRTMVKDAEFLGSRITIGNDSRITRCGTWLRRYKLDELPQLINVLRGDMSLVGPRPEVPEYVEFYSDDDRKVLNLMPGITDPASIAFRDEAGFLSQSIDPRKEYIEKLIPQKIAMNLQYYAKANLFTDILVILATLGLKINV